MRKNGPDVFQREHNTHDTRGGRLVRVRFDAAPGAMPGMDPAMAMRNTRKALPSAFGSSIDTRSGRSPLR